MWTPHKTKNQGSHAENSGTLWTSLGNSQVPASMVSAMRWDNLFHDLEAQLETILGDELEDKHRDSERAKRASQSLGDYLHEQLALGAITGPLVLSTGGTALWITVDNFGSDWIAGEVSAPIQHAGYCIVNLASIDRISVGGRSDSLSSRQDEPCHRIPGGVARRQGRITLRIVLRDVVRRRKTGWLVGGGEAAHGTLDRIGKDFVELVEHAPNAPRRQESIEKRVWVKLAALSFYRLDD